MPGQYARQWYPTGNKDVASQVKPVRSGQCECGRLSYRERFTPGIGWQWLCYACAPDPRIERRYAAGHKPMGYVPDDIHPADRIAAKLKSGDYVAKDLQGNIKDGWKPKRASIS